MVKRPDPRGSARRSAAAGNVGQGAKWISRSTRYRIYMRDGWRCLWCLQPLYAVRLGTPIGPHASAPDRTVATLDHIVPRASGGANAPGNLVTSCIVCNEKRGDLTAIGFAYRAAPVRMRGELSPHATLNRVTDAMGRALPSKCAAFATAGVPCDCKACREAAEAAE